MIQTMWVAVLRARWRSHALRFLLLLMLVSGAQTRVAWAHASLVAAEPPSGALLAQAPPEVLLHFNEPVSPLVFKLFTPDGVGLDVTRVDARAGGLAVALPALAAHGTYALSWRVVSSDGHPVGGTTTFSVGQSSAVAASAVAASVAVSPGRQAALWLMRWLAYTGLFLGIGAVVAYTGWAAHARRSRAVPVLLGVGALAMAASLGLLGLDALDAPWRALGQAAPWQAAGATAFAATTLGAVLALVLAACAWGMASHRARLLSLMALGTLGVALALSGHASTSAPTWLTRPAVAMHAIAIALWVGALWPLARALRDPDTGARALATFSRHIPWVLVALVVSGSVLVYRQFDQPASLWTTAYGRVLLAKLALLVGLLGLAAVNRYRLTPRVMQRQEAAAQTLRRVIGMELLVAVCVLGVAALWRFTPPPRALTVAPVAVSAPVVSAHLLSAAATADLALVPDTQGGAAELQLYLSDAQLSLLRAQEVAVVFSNTDSGVEPIRYDAVFRPDDGTWRVARVALPSLPRWRVRVEALISDFDRLVIDGELAMDHAH